MLREFMVPLATLCACAIASIAGLDRLCLFHQTYQTMVAKLESERWLLQQCSDPHFFSRMHQHSDLCFQACAHFSLVLVGCVDRWARQVENNARVGAFMLALRHLTQSFLPADVVGGLVASSRLVSWPALAGLGALLLLGPSWLARGGSVRPNWARCADGHFKDA